MDKYIGKAFEELDSQEMINIQGGATPTVATTTSSTLCMGASAGLTAVSVFSVIVVTFASAKIFG